MSGGKPRGQTITVAQAATLLGRSDRWVQGLVKAGYMDRAQRGEYTLVGVIRGALAYYEDQLSKNNKAAVASRATEARTREIELRIQERSRELIPMEDAKAVVGEMAALVRADFELHAGEVLGLAGLAGSGRGALLRAVLGAGPRAGRLTLDGAAVGQSPAEAWAQGIAYVPRERRAEGLIIGRPIFENVTLPHLQCFARAGVFVDTAHEKRRSHNLGNHVRLKATSIMQVCAELSGGNQQKVLFARALAGKPRVLLLDEPTRGVDIGARFDIYRLIQNLRDEGVSILLASSDLPELLGVSDRIGVMRDGILTEILKADNLSEGSLLARFYHRQEAQT